MSVFSRIPEGDVIVLGTVTTIKICIFLPIAISFRCKKNACEVSGNCTLQSKVKLGEQYD